MRPFPAVLRIALAAALLAAAGGGASADIVELNDGTRLDGKVIQEKDGFLWVRTLAETRKVAAADVRSRTPGESPADVFARLRAKSEKDPKDAAAAWELYVFCAEHAAESKDVAQLAKSLPAKILKLAPDHEGAHDALGETRYEGRWVRKEDVPRLEAEAARRKKQEEWQEKLGLRLELYDGEHWTLIDNTGDKDLSKRAKEMDEAYRLMCEILGAEKFWDGQAPAVAVKRYEDFTRILDDKWKSWGLAEWIYKAARLPALGGFWNHRPAAMQMRCIPEAKTDAEEGMWAAFVHNVVHVTIWTQPRAGEPPTWFEEGLASIVETEVRGTQKAYCVGLKGTEKHKTSDKHPKAGKDGKDLAGEQSVLKEHCRKAVEDDVFPEMRKFLRMKMGEYTAAEAGGALGLVTWLRAKDPEKFKLLWAEIRKGPARDDQPWEKVYGWKLIEDMEKEWKTWVRSEW